jgi:iron(III) transport system permease protein
VPKPDRQRDLPLLVYSAVIGVIMVSMLGMAAFTSLVSFWPYNMQLTLNHYTYGLAEAGVLNAYLTSLSISALTALVGTPFIFVTAYLVEKTQSRPFWLRPLIRALATLPMGVPGLVLGIGYILFFNARGNPLNGLYQTLAIMVLANVVHYYTSCHLSALTALKSIDREFEAVSASLGVSQIATFWRVTLPICLPAVLEIARYLFINAMTTVSALVFLYSPGNMPASVSILQLDEAGDLGPAAAMATLIVLTTISVSVLYSIATHYLLRRHQAWRQIKR